MSTKIYNAFRMPASSLDEVINTFFDNKSDIQTDIELYFIKEVLLEMIKKYDDISLEGNIFALNTNKEQEMEETPYSIIMDKFWNKNKNIDNTNDDAKEKEILLIVYPQSIEHFGQKSYMMQLYAEEGISKIIYDKYLKKFGIEEYNYWNNTDKPDTITDYEWEIRNKNWSKIDIPILNGLNITFLKSSKYEIFYTYGYNTKKHLVHTALENILKEYTLEKRIEKNIFKVKEKIAYKECYDQFIIDHNLDNTEQSVLKDILISKGMKIYFKALDKARDNNFNEEQIVEIADKGKEIKILLKEDFILEDFKTSRNEIQLISKNKKNKKLKL